MFVGIHIDKAVNDLQQKFRLTQQPFVTKSIFLAQIRIFTFTFYACWEYPQRVS